MIDRYHVWKLVAVHALNSSVSGIFFAGSSGIILLARDKITLIGCSVEVNQIFRITGSTEDGIFQRRCKYSLATSSEYTVL